MATLKFSKVCEYTHLTFLYNLLLVLGQYLLPFRRRCNYKFAMTHGRTHGRTYFFIVIDIYIYICVCVYIYISSHAGRAQARGPSFASAGVHLLPGAPAWSLRNYCPFCFFLAITTFFEVAILRYATTLFW